MTLDAATLYRFWSKVDNSSPDGCWLWMAGVTRDGYGQIHVGRKRLYAHRISAEIAGGSIPAGMCVLHNCDVPACVRPSHLRIGTHQENMRDRADRGRTATGAMMPHSKLNESAAMSIRERYARGESQADLAREYCVSGSTIAKVIARKKWNSPESLTDKKRRAS